MQWSPNALGHPVHREEMRKEIDDIVSKASFVMALWH